MARSAYEQDEQPATKDRGTDSVAGDLAAAARMPSDLMLLKMEGESIMAAAARRPRAPATIVAELRAMLDAYPAAADDAIYSKPVGSVVEIRCGGCGHKYEVPYVGNDGVRCPKCDSPKIGAQRKVTKFAENLSVRAAESIRTAYGFNRMTTSAEVLDDGSVRLSGTFVDYASGTFTSDQRIVSPFYTDRHKRQQRIAADRFLGVVVKAEKSKLRRDVILDSVPAFVKAAYRDACERKLAELVTPEIIAQEILPRFAEQGVTADMLDALIGKPHRMGWSEADRVRCRTIYAALQSGETTVAELLADIAPPQQAAPATAPPAGAVSSDDLTRPGAAATTTRPGQTSKPATDAGQADASPPADPIGPETALANEITTQLARAAAFGQESLRKVWTKYCGPESTLSDDLRQHAQQEYERLLPTARPQQTRGKAADKQGDLLP